MKPLLTEADFIREAKNLNCSVAAIKSAAKVESRGIGFLADGRPKTLFEAHHFSRLTGHKYDKIYPSISSRKWDKSLYLSADGEHQRLEEACKLDRNAALQSASWGKFQVMGFNWKDAGFSSLQSFINAMYESEAGHLKAFVGYVKANKLDGYLRTLDWEAFARGYNGPGYKANRYDIKLEQAYKSFLH